MLRPAGPVPPDTASPGLPLSVTRVQAWRRLGTASRPSEYLQQLQPVAIYLEREYYQRPRARESLRTRSPRPRPPVTRRSPPTTALQCWARPAGAVRWAARTQPRSADRESHTCHTAISHICKATNLNTAKPALGPRPAGELQLVCRGSVY